MESIFQFYMMQADARHCHPDQATKRGAMHNDNYSIPNSEKIWKLRNSIWLYKNAMSVWQNGDLEAFCHKGSNATEFFHRNTVGRFDYLKKEPIHLSRIPVIISFQKLTHNIRRARLIQQRIEQAKKYDPENWQIHEKILKKLQQLSGLDLLREDFRDDHTAHHYLNFDNTNKTVDDFLHGFNWKNAVVRITKLKYEDKQLIWEFIEKYKSTLETSDGKLWNNKMLKQLQDKIHHSISLNKLKQLIVKYWIIDDDLVDDIIEELKDSNEDNNEDDYDFGDINNQSTKPSIDDEYDISPVAPQTKKAAGYDYFFKTYSNIFKYIQTYSNIFKHIQIYSNIFKYIQTYLYI